MRNRFTTLKAALFGGLALAAVAPGLSAAAAEPMRLGNAQLDSVTAGVIDVGVSTFGDGTATGSLFSNTNTLTLNQAQGTPAVGIATGTVVTTSLAIGGDETPASSTATGNATVDSGTTLFQRNFGRTITSRGVSFSYFVGVAVAGDSEFPVGF